MAGATHFALREPYASELSLSAIRKRGTGARFQTRDGSEAGQTDSYDAPHIPAVKECGRE